jgi:hypothetical protein
LLLAFWVKVVTKQVRTIASYDEMSDSAMQYPPREGTLQSFVKPSLDSVADD